MRNWRSSVVPLVILGGLLFWAAPTVSGQNDGTGSDLVDFRMAPLEQAKKINQLMQARHGSGETLTVMAWNGVGDGRHMILPAPPADLAERFGSGVDSVSWPAQVQTPKGTCDSRRECEQRTREMCEQAGHGGVNEATVTVTLHADGSQTCSADCTANGAVAMVTCNP